MKRRNLLIGALAGIVALFPALRQKANGGHSSNLRFLRPPGALAESEFLSECIRCGQCGEVCPNSAIKFFDLENGISAVNTPYIIPREKACILCMKCGEICPTGAIKEIVRDATEIVKQVHMGKAIVNKNICLSYQGKSCGVCYRACPLQDVSIQVGFMEQPTVLKDCIGCGQCERACIQMPQAIRIVPNYTRTA